MTPDEIMQAWADGKWLILAIAAITYLTRLTAPDSKFPVHIPTRWAPLVALVLGQVLAVLQVVAGGTTAPRAVFNGAVVSFMSMGSFDIIAKAMMGNAEWPQWLKTLALVFDRKPEPARSPDVPTPLEKSLAAANPPVTVSYPPEEDEDPPTLPPA